MKLNPVFQSASVPIPDRSGFDLSKEHLFTAPVGTVVPAEVIEVLPNDTFSMGSMMKVTLPPFAVPFMGRVDACLESFFIPSRILWKGWQAFITQNAGVQGTASSQVTPLRVPSIDTNSAGNAPYFGSGTLSDYLGYTGGVSASSPILSALPYLAYHKVLDYWYRDQNNIKPFFAKNVNSLTPSAASLAVLPHIVDSFSYQQSAVLSLAPYSGTTTLSDFVDMTLGLGSLRQRCWAKDYFTTATTRPQAGDAAQITFSTSGSTGSITVSDIRVANALQRWLERNNIAGTEYGSQILAHFGVTPPDAVLDKPLLLGQIREPVYIGSVENNSNADSSDDTRNPFGTNLGTAAGHGASFGKGQLINEFHAKEHGFIMIMFSLVPHAYYESGVEKQLMHTTIGDFGWPEYARIGDQAIYGLELTPDAGSHVFGYNQRYSEYKFRLDKVSGLFHDNENLAVYALKRGFSVEPDLGKEFLEIPTTYLDQVSQVDTNVSSFGCMVDCYFDTRSIRLLPSYSLPSL